MRTLMRFSRNHPVLVVLFLLTVTALAAYKAKDIRLEASVAGMMSDDPRARRAYEQTIDTFGTDQVTVVSIRDKDLFSPDRLADVEEIAYQLEGLPGVVRVESLFTAANFHARDGVLQTGPLMKYPPETDDEARQAKEKALANPLLKGNLISEDATATAINVFVEPPEDEGDYYARLAKEVEGVLEPFKGNFESLYQLGNPYFRTLIAKTLLEDQFTLVPLSVLVLVLTLVLMTRTISGAALPLMTAGMSVAWTVAFMVMTGIPLNLLTIIVPSLIIVIGSTEDIHLLAEYTEGLHETGAKKLAIEYMISKMGIVIMITALTTFLGFASITVNKIEILRQFGMAAAFGLLVNPIITVLFVPAYFHFFGSKKPKQHKLPDPQAGPESTDHDGKPFFQRLADSITNLVNTRKKHIIWGMCAIAVVSGLLGFNVRLNNDILGVFKESSEIRVRVADMAEHLPGVQTFYIRVSGGHPGVFKKPGNLRQIAQIQDFIADQGVFDSTFSLADSLRLINREMNGGDPEKFTVPESEALVAQYLLFMHEDDTRRYVNQDHSQACILVRHNLQSSHEVKDALEDLSAFIKREINPHFIIDYTGEAMLILKGADAIAEGQAKSISLLLVIIFVIMSVLFVNMKAGLLSLVPNIFPVCIMFGAMSIFRIPLNIGTAMVSAIAIGIAVDDTIHFMTRYNKEMLVLKDQKLAMESCIHSEIRPVISTSLALALGFGILVISQFVTIIQFGILSALVMIVALLGDLFLTPALLSTTKLLTLWDMLSLSVRQDVVEQSEFFRDLKMWQIKKIILMGRILDKKASETIFEEWDDGDSMFLLLDGQVRSLGVDEASGKEIPYALYGPGDVFGQTGMLDRGPRSSTTRADSDVRVVEISRDDFARLHTLYPRIASKAHRNLARILGHRLVISNLMYRQKAGQTTL